MTQLVKITRWAGRDIDPQTTDPQYFGTLDVNTWATFLSFEDFPEWPEDYDTYHAPVPNQTSWEEIRYEDLPEAMRNWETENGYSLKDHVDWMLEEDESDPISDDD